jgi:hypothetical protein
MHTRVGATDNHPPYQVVEMDDILAGGHYEEDCHSADQSPSDVDRVAPLIVAPIGPLPLERTSGLI